MRVPQGVYASPPRGICGSPRVYASPPGGICKSPRVFIPCISLFEKVQFACVYSVFIEPSLFS